MNGVTRRGAKGSPTILFLHGGVINRHMWGPVMDVLDPQYECIAIDLPGHGDLADRPFSIQSSVDTVRRALETHTIEDVSMVGLSLGGYVAQAVTAAHPDRVKGLVLSGATIRYTGWDGLSTRLYGALFPLLARPAAKAFASKMKDDLGDDVANPILNSGLSMKGGGQALRRLPGRDYAALMKNYRGPIIVANGERDTDNRDAEHLFLEHHPAAESIVIEDAGHACALQKPVAFARVVDQLALLAK